MLYSDAMTNADSNYIVLARKYRPQDLGELVGQEALVKILNNSIREKKVAHSFLLSGIRGIGKTTTARIIAKTLNCTDLQEKDGVYVPCHKCKNCLSAAEQSHPDIIELDAASKTGVGDIREVIENSTYAPILGRYKIYIIDEVHMLSNSAFNALLKTLEEPPAHLKFIFATTEYRKIPLTIISRCQKHDLRSFTVETLMELIQKVCKKEEVDCEEQAVKIIATHAQGSARDALSLLDMVILNSNSKITAEFVEKTLGVSDKGTSYKLFDNLFKGETAACIETAHKLFLQGIEPSYLIEDLLEICTEASKMLSVANYKDSAYLSEFDKAQLQQITAEANIPRLSRIWQMLFKGISELKSSDLPIPTIEMLFIRICYLSSEPTPVEMASELKKKSKSTIDQVQLPTNTPITNFGAIVELLKKKKEMILYHHLRTDVIPLSLEGTHLKLKPTVDGIGFINQLKTKLKEFTHKSWTIEIVKDAPSDNNKEHKTLQEKELEDIKNNEMISAVFNNFSDVKIESIKTIKQ
ncbi:MAG: DNA polymerase III subunit gamma/tau [Rickettsiales bacterium]